MQQMGRGIQRNSRQTGPPPGTEDNHACVKLGRRRQYRLRDVAGVSFTNETAGANPRRPQVRHYLVHGVAPGSPTMIPHGPRKPGNRELPDVHDDDLVGGITH